MDQALTERYAAAPPWRRRATIALVVLVAVAGLAWLAWAAYEQATPQVESQLVGFHVAGPHAVTTSVDVTIASGATGVTCLVEAVAQDHSVVGELRFTPRSGTNEVTVRTQRQATSITLAGCTAHGQSRPR